MKIISKINTLLLLVFFGLLFSACKKQDEKTNKTDSQKPISEMSIYNLPSKWTNQDGKELELKSLRGDVLVMVMIYTSCKAACPRLVADMRNIESHLNAKSKEKVKFILISIDPEVDTPKRLKAFAIENKMTDKQWMFLRSSEENTREFAAVLAVNYKKITPIDFSHSNIISVFNAAGELVYQQEGINVNDAATIIKIKEETQKL